MGRPVAVEGDRVEAVDQHLLVQLAPPGATSTLPLPFSGVLEADLSPTVRVCGRRVATLGSRATNQPPHLPPAGTAFTRPPSNTATVVQGSSTVFVGGRPVARAGDRATTCNDPADLAAGTVSSNSTVLAG